MTTNFCNRRGINQYGGTTTENDGGETNDGIDEGREDAVTASNEKDWRVVDTHSLESLPDAEAHCTGDFFIDEFNCGNCLDIETELQNDSLCIDGFEHGGTSVISKQNVSTSEENNIDVAYEGRMAQTFFNEEKAPPPPHPEMRYIVMSISVFAILGCLARVYTDILFHDRLGATTTGSTLVVLSFYSNIIGTMILGFMIGLHTHSEMLYIIEVGIGTGFCGSYTTFSSWEMEFALQLKEGEILETLTHLISSAALFIISYIFGIDLAEHLMSYKWIESWWKMSKAHYGQVTIACTVAFCSLVPMLVLLIVLDDRNFTRRAGWLSSLLAPLGALGRYFIGKALNHSCRGGQFPLGTFCSNIAAATSLALMGHSSPKTPWGNLFHEAFTNGLLASLSTMSSFLSEVLSLRRLFGNVSSYVYFSVSIIFGTVTSGVLGPIWIWD